jgi:hypothetical protein
MQLHKATLSWRDHPVVTTGNVHGWFADHLPDGFGRYLPASLVICADEEVAPESIERFMFETAAYLEEELRRRIVRQRRFVELGLFRNDEIIDILTGSTHIQPWLLYYSRDGGVGAIDGAATPEHAARGYKPCSSMTNHGVAWLRHDDRYATWLVTARKAAQPWDWDSDIGHESAHAAFAPVPLFTQLVHIAAVPITELTASFGPLTGNHIGRLGYPFSELAVVSVRGEPRATKTRLPVLETPEMLLGFLELATTLVPDVGFDRALHAAELVSGVVDVVDGTEMFEIAAPILKLMPALARMAASVYPPSADWYRVHGAGPAATSGGKVGRSQNGSPENCGNRL